MLGLAGMMITETAMEEGNFSLSFVDADVIKTMDGARQRTRWKQSGRLLIRQAEAERVPQQSTPYTLAGGDLTDNVYIYRDSVRLPLHSHGHVGIELSVRQGGEKLIVHGKEIEIVMQGTAHYLEHLDKNNAASS